MVVDASTKRNNSNLQSGILLLKLLDQGLHAFPRFVTALQLHFTSLAVVSLREDFHLRGRANAGRTKKKAPNSGAF